MPTIKPPPPPTKKGRGEALGRAKAHLAKKLAGNELRAIIQDHANRRPNVQTEDRATALVLGSILEQGIETAIFSHCAVGRKAEDEEAERRKLFGSGEDPPMNFAVKIRLAYALGVYGSNARDDLDLMRTIRNLFAHDQGHLSFDDEVVLGLCRQIKWLDTFQWGGVLSKQTFSPRQIFVDTTDHFFSFLVANAANGPVRYINYPAVDLYS
jgi:DNA-binding MltR family transcriptional regulator